MRLDKGEVVNAPPSTQDMELIEDLTVMEGLGIEEDLALHLKANHYRTFDLVFKVFRDDPHLQGLHVNCA